MGTIHQYAWGPKVLITRFEAAAVFSLHGSHVGDWVESERSDINGAGPVDLVVVLSRPPATHSDVPPSDTPKPDVFSLFFGPLWRTFSLKIADRWRGIVLCNTRKWYHVTKWTYTSVFLFSNSPPAVPSRNITYSSTQDICTDEAVGMDGTQLAYKNMG